MIHRNVWVTCLPALAAGLLLTQVAQADGKVVRPTAQWCGKVVEAAERKTRPGEKPPPAPLPPRRLTSPVITDRGTLEKLWQSWRVPHKMPKVDFTKEIVVVVTASGSKVLIQESTLDKGDLRL